MISKKRKIQNISADSNAKMTKSEILAQPINTHREAENPLFSKVFHNVDKSHLQHLFGFTLNDIQSWKNFVRIMYKPMDPASLGVMRALFGILMVFDIPEERGLSDIDVKWGDPSHCHFPLFNFLSPLPLPWMGIIYLIMWLGAIGITFGFMYHFSCIAFIVPYWYILLLDKSVWNNHSYLYGLVGIILLGCGANHYWSLDVFLGLAKRDMHVPLWNYAILRFQFFILYFFAGLKKFDTDWLEGYSMTHLNRHWIFDPFKLFLTPEQIDYWLVHLAGFLLDLTIGFWLFFDKTRPYAFVFCSSFHLMNSRLFTIGMFPYVCLVTLPIFSHVDWPRKILQKMLNTKSETPCSKNSSCIYTAQPHTKLGINNASKSNTDTACVTWKHNVVVGLLMTHVGLQVFLPYSHFITKGYNNWTNGLYGYSWDMMVHSWDTILVIVKVVDNKSGKEHFLDSEAWVQNDRWTKHADMLVQYGQCLKRNLLNERTKNTKMQDYITSNNISIYIDVWSSLNGRFQQRMFDPQIDILKARWSPFEPTPWLMPLLSEFSSWRKRMDQMEQEVYSWANNSDVLFVADFPGLTLENYINPDLANVTLTILEGEVTVEERVEKQHNTLYNKYSLEKGKSIKVAVGKFHSVQTVSPTPSCFMYAYTNQSKEQEAHKDQPNKELLQNFLRRHIDNFVRAITLVSNSILNVCCSVPMVKRVKIG